MAQCEMCSKDLPLIEAEIEGVSMKVCQACSKFGTVKNTPVTRKPQSVRKSRPVRRRPQIDEEMMEFVVPNAGELVKSAREKRKMRQIDLSRQLSISESEIHQVESGHLRPTLAIAKRFEEGLNIKLIAKRDLTKKPEVYGTQDDDVGGMTIGDMIKIKKK